MALDFDKTLNDARTELAEIESRAEKLRVLIGALSGNSSVGPIEISISREYPKPKEAILTVLRSHPDVAMTQREVIARVREMDLFDPNMKSGVSGYGVALRRLVDGGRVPVVLNDDGTFTYQTVASLLQGSLEYPSYAGGDS